MTSILDLDIEDPRLFKISDDYFRTEFGPVYDELGDFFTQFINNWYKLPYIFRKCLWNNFDDSKIASSVHQNRPRRVNADELRMATLFETSNRPLPNPHFLELSQKLEWLPLELTSVGVKDSSGRYLIPMMLPQYFLKLLENTIKDFNYQIVSSPSQTETFYPLVSQGLNHLIDSKKPVSYKQTCIINNDFELTVETASSTTAASTAASTFNSKPLKVETAAASKLRISLNKRVISEIPTCCEIKMHWTREYLIFKPDKQYHIYNIFTGDLEFVWSYSGIPYPLNKSQGLRAINGVLEKYIIEDDTLQTSQIFPDLPIGVNFPNCSKVEILLSLVSNMKLLLTLDF